MKGISVIVCCHNSSSRLSATLDHLKAQESMIAPWEVLIIDNRSSDATADFARSNWANGPVPLRVIDESRLGVRFARERGFSEARYPFLAFVDDDNWLAPDWLRTAHEIISSDSSLGAVGSIIVPACEVPAPAWFDDFHSIYALLTERDFEHAPQPPKYLPTAGLCVRKKAWERLIANQFRFQLSGTVGTKPQGGEDTELTSVFRLCGWRLAVSPRLHVKHFIPARRLRWMYLRGLTRGYAASNVLLDAYSDHSLSLSGFRGWVSDRWWYQLAREFSKLAPRSGSVLVALFSEAEGRYDVIEIEKLFGRAIGLLKSRGRYGSTRQMVRRAGWPPAHPFRTPPESVSAGAPARTTS
jgi:glycosyltransferase involved in cell wall biosynthesis